MYTVLKVHLTLKFVFGNADSNSNSKYRVYSKLIFFSWQMSKFTDKYMNTSHTLTHAHMHTTKASVVLTQRLLFWLPLRFVWFVFFFRLFFFFMLWAFIAGSYVWYVTRRSLVDTGSFKQNKTNRSLTLTVHVLRVYAYVAFHRFNVYALDIPHPSCFHFVCRVCMYWSRICLSVNTRITKLSA